MTPPTSSAANLDHLARALRNEDVGAFADTSPTAACFVPLLRELGWEGDNRAVLEALPHFASDMNLTDLRATLALLGYSSEPEKLRFNQVDMRLLPYLFKRESDGELFVVTGFNGTQIFALANGRKDSFDLGSSNFRGTAYFFTKTPDLPTGNEERVTNWYTHILLRFKPYFARILAVSFIINLLTISIPLFIMLIYDKVVGAHSLRALPYLAAGVAIVLLGDMRLRTIRAEIISALAGRLDYLIGIAAFEKILSFPPTMTESATVSTQMARLKEFQSLRDFFTGPLINTAVELPFIVLVLITIYLLGGAIVTVPLLAILAFFVMGWLWLPQVRRTTLAFSKADRKRANFLNEATKRLRTIKDLGAENTWRARFRTLSSETLTLQDQLTRETALTEIFTVSVIMLSAIGVLGLGALSAIDGNMTTGALIAVLTLLWRALGPFQSGFLTFTRFREIRDSVQLVNQMMAMKSEATGHSSRLFETKLHGNIVFNRVSFRYKPNADPALMAVSLKIPERKIIAILGANPSGKSTLAKLITGMYQPQAGTITIDGLDIRQISPQVLRRNIAYVPQTPEIFYGTIRQNLQLAEPMASDEEIDQACKDSGLDELIKLMPDKLDTRIGNTQKTALPTGFIQRLSIARALVRRSKILLLDEPEQSLDSSGDRIFIEMIKKLKGQATIVLISHRPSHIKLADHAVVMNNGAVEFSGSPSDALAAAQIIANRLVHTTASQSPDSRSGVTA